MDFLLRCCRQAYNSVVGRAGTVAQAEDRRISFAYDQQKANQALLWLLHRHGGTMDKLKLVKLVFYADREHLRQYGRPIIGGQYVAMRHGPISSELYDQLKVAAEKGRLPFTVQDRTQVIADGQLDEGDLSESDMQVLRWVYDEYGFCDPYRLRNMTHELEAWKRNYPDPTENTSRPLPYEDFFLDIGDDGMLETIIDHQEALGTLR